MKRRALLLSGLCTLRGEQRTGEDWPSFLGPRHNGTSLETNLRKSLPPPLLWQHPKGTGYASPAVAEGRLVLFHRQGGNEIVECLEPESGKSIWRNQYTTEFEDRYGYNNGPRSSPVMDDGFVYTIGAEAKLRCLRLSDGGVVWAHDLRAEYKLKQDFFGVSSTPLIEGPHLILNLGAPGGPTVAAFEKRTGKFAWGSGNEWGASYASPIPATVQGKRRVFIFAGGESQPPTGGLIMLDPGTGAVDFTFPWRSRSYESVNASCPVIEGNRAFISASYRTGSAMLEIQPNLKPKLLWTTQEFGLHFSTPIIHDGHIYGFDGRNEPDASLACLDASNGKLKWRTTLEWTERIERNGEVRNEPMSLFRGSLLRADNKYLALGEFGHLCWLDLSPAGCKELARARLFAARETWSLPVLSRGLLYVVQHTRDFLHNTGPRLLCYSLRG